MEQKGYHLILDFINLPDEILKLEKFTKLINILLSEKKVYSDNFVTLKRNDQTILSYVASSAHYKLIFNTTKKTANFDCLLWSVPNSEIVKKTEIIVCEELGWKHCVSTTFFPINNNSIYLNDSLNRGIIFSKFKFLQREKTPLNEIRVYETSTFGKALILNRFVQFIEDPKKVLNKALIDPIIKENKEYQNVLVIGLNDLAVVSELNNNKNIKKIIIFESDPILLDILKKHWNFEEKYEKEIQSGRIILSISQNLNEFLNDFKSKNILFDAAFLCRNENEDSLINHYDKNFYNILFSVLNTESSFAQKIENLERSKLFEENIKENGFKSSNISVIDVPDQDTKLVALVGHK